MKWEKPVEALVEILDEKLSSANCEKKKMFGQWAYFANGYMFTGVHQESLFLRLPPEKREEVFQTHDEAEPFEPMKGRVMSEYVSLPPEIYENNEDLSKLLNLSLEYVQSLPPKEKKSKSKK